MNSKKAYFVMLGVLGVLSIMIVGSVVLGNMLLKKQSDKLVALKLDNQVIDEQLKSVVQAKKDIDKYSELNNIAKQIVPQDKDQAKATREIVNLAEQSGIKIASVAFPASNLGAAIPKSPVTPATGTSVSTPTPTPATPAAPTITQVKPVDGVNGVYQLDITVISESTLPVSYAQLVQFLQKLEQNRRTSQVTQINIQTQPNAGLHNLSFNLTITVYIKP